MPFVDVKISEKLLPADELLLKEELGKAISFFPGKSEGWLMCNIESDKHIWFKGKNDQPNAFIEVKLFGSVDPDAAERFTAELCDFLEAKFRIPSSGIYIRYEGGDMWGWNGGNF